MRALMDLDRGLAPQPSSDESLGGIGVGRGMSLLDGGIEGAGAYGVPSVIELSL